MRLKRALIPAALAVGLACGLGVAGCRKGGGESDPGGRPPAERAGSADAVTGRVVWRTRREALVQREGDVGPPVWVDAERAPGPPDEPDGAGAGAAPPACRVAVLTLGEGERDEVGLHVTAEALARSLRALEALGDDRPGVVVLRLDTRGGRLAEAPFIADVIEGRAEKSYRVVAWVEEARSAGALIAMVCDEIVMMPGAALGDAVAHAPGAGVERGGLQGASLRVGEIVSRMGGRDPAIVRAMQTTGALSCDIGADGSVRWREDASGQVMVSEPGAPLVLGAEMAERTRISIGTAATRDELAALLGCAGGVAWVEAGDAAQRDQRVAAPLVVARGEALSQAIEVWSNACEEGRRLGGDVVTREDIEIARDRLDRLRALVDSAPFLSRYAGFGEGWLDVLAERIEACAAGE